MGLFAALTMGIDSRMAQICRDERRFGCGASLAMVFHEDAKTRSCSLRSRYGLPQRYKGNRGLFAALTMGIDSRMTQIGGMERRFDCGATLAMVFHEEHKEHGELFAALTMGIDSRMTQIWRDGTQI